MSTKRVVIKGDEELEGLLKEGDGGAGVVICHPHPLYGGSMHNNVVSAIDTGYWAKGYTTLRFNFRGVGGSSGTYGEGEGETRDLVAAFGFLKEVCQPRAHLALAGYSFGAWIAVRTAYLLADVSSMFLVALPVAAYGAGSLSSYAGPLYLVGGAYDDIAPVEDIKELYDGFANDNKHLKVIPTSHFFESREREIAEYIKESIHDPNQDGAL